MLHKNSVKGGLVIFNSGMTFLVGEVTSYNVVDGLVEVILGTLGGKEWIPDSCIRNYISGITLDCINSTKVFAECISNASGDSIVLHEGTIVISNNGDFYLRGVDGFDYFIINGAFVARDLSLAKCELLRKAKFWAYSYLRGYVYLKGYKVVVDTDWDLLVDRMFEDYKFNKASSNGIAISRSRIEGDCRLVIDILLTEHTLILDIPSSMGCVNSIDEEVKVFLNDKKQVSNKGGLSLIDLGISEGTEDNGWRWSLDLTRLFMATGI
jgi:hypothetical protein